MTMEPILPKVKQVIDELLDNTKPILSSRLIELSNLNSQGLSALEQACASIELSRKRHIIGLLVELAENNFEFNFDDIFKYCLKDKDAEIRVKAIEGLSENEAPSLIDPLIKLLNEDSSEKVQAAAATALGKFAMLAELNKLRPAHSSKVSQVLIAVLNDRSKPLEVKRRALEAAAPLTLPQVKTAITEAYHGNDQELKASAVYAMGRTCDSSWLPVLLQELSSPHSEMRYEAAGACGELCDKEAVPQLIKLTNDPDIDVQMAAIQALGKIGGSKAKQCLNKCLSSPDESICQVAEEALRQLESEEDSFIV